MGTGELHTLGTQRSYGVLRPEWPTVIQEGHGHEIVAEHDAAYTDEREDANEDSRGVPSLEINALVLEHALEHSAPSMQMKVRPMRLPADEVVPLLSRTGKSSNPHSHGAVFQKENI
jgi:hypothetical protein